MDTNSMFVFLLLTSISLQCLIVVFHRMDCWVMSSYLDSENRNVGLVWSPSSSTTQTLSDLDGPLIA